MEAMEWLLWIVLGIAFITAIILGIRWLAKNILG